ncbi:hypothetical protein ACHAWF_004521 [Thalassiosira exigua]
MTMTRVPPAALFLLLGVGFPPAADAFSTKVGGVDVDAVRSVPPAPFRWPVLGTLPDFVARGGVDRLREIYEDMYSEYGDVFEMSILGASDLVVSDPRVYEDACRRGEGDYPIGGAEMVTTFGDYYKENNATMAMKSISRGPEWREWRDSVEPDLYIGWRGYLPSIADTARSISEVAGREVMEEGHAFVDFVSRSAFDLFSTVMYGESPRTTDGRASNQEDLEFVRSTQRAFDATGSLISDPLNELFKGSIYQDFKANMDMTMDFAYSRTREYVRRAAGKEVDGLTAEDAESEASSDSKCPMQGLKRSIEGSFENPSFVERLLAAELKSTLKGDDVSTLEQMNSLPYLRACIRESHRLTPPAVIQTKSLNEDVDVVVDGAIYRVPVESRVSLNLRGWPMDPKYVDEPHAYRPERFLPDAVAERRGTKSEVALDHPSFADPFGRGKRRCLGSNVAIAEITIFAARIIQDYEITLKDPKDAGRWRPKQKLLLKADPYPAMKLVPRE